MQRRLDWLRDDYGSAIVLTSGLRCSDWNHHWGGVAKSAHLSGEAVDIACGEGASRRRLVQLAMAAKEADGAYWFPLVEIGRAHVHLETPYRPAPVLILA